MRDEFRKITYTSKGLTEAGYQFENNIIELVDVNVIGHFENATCFEIFCLNVVPNFCCNHLGKILQFFVEFFDIDNEDGIRISQIKNIPCRLIFEKNNCNNLGQRVVGIGHFMKDRFALFEDMNELIDCRSDENAKSVN